MKHAVAIATALIGMGLAAIIRLSWLSVMWGLIGGMLIGYFLAGLVTARQNSLQQAFVRLGDLRGKSLDEIVTAAGPYRAMESVTITDRDNAPGFFYTWSERDYLITLLFDADNVCIGINREILNDR